MIDCSGVWMVFFGGCCLDSWDGCGFEMKNDRELGSRGKMTMDNIVIGQTVLKSEVLHHPEVDRANYLDTAGLRKQMGKFEFAMSLGIRFLTVPWYLELEVALQSSGPRLSDIV